ncbi:MAG: hypothetical protein ACJ8AG_15690 [Ktedonobacteraceae bacterium]
MTTQQDNNASIPEDTLLGGFRTQEMLLNMGPQHPSTHGVMRLVLKLEGETVVECTPVIGYLRVGGVLHDFPKGWLKECESYLDQLEKNMGELERLVTGNEIFEARTQGVGYIDPQQAIAYGLSGPIVRGSGITWDVRVTRPYMAYREVPVHVQVRQEGDCYARYQVRMKEIRESMRLCRVTIDQMPGGSIGTRTPIAQRPPRGETYFAIESSRGELGIYLISDGSEYPWRAKIRGPSFVNLQILPELLRGHKMSDVVAIIGSLDPIFGEVDR